MNAKATSDRADDLLTIADAIREFRVSVSTLRRRAKDGSLPHRRLTNRLVFRRGDLERVLFHGEFVGGTE